MKSRLNELKQYLINKLLKIVEETTYVLTGEFILKKRPNGGAVIIFRSLWVSIIAFGLAILISEGTSPNNIYPLQFSSIDLLTAINKNLDWLAAFIGFSYLALYTRFASQWNYLADLYNRIMQSRADNASNEFSFTYKKLPLKKLTQKEQIYAYWMAAFIHDARDLHLSEKQTYKSVIESMLDLPGVLEALGEADYSDYDSDLSENHRNSSHSMPE